MTVELFVAAVPGLEPVVVEELGELGISGTPDRGGVLVRGEPDLIGTINRWSRCATRVLLRVGSFRARHLSELEKRIPRLDWRGLPCPDRPVRFKVTSLRSKLYHTEAVAQRFHHALEERAGGSLERLRGDRLPVDLADVLTVHIRIESDEVRVSLDTSGAHLHQRGYRLDGGKAPLRENLAACFLRRLGWPTGEAFLDPMCGSGTIPIEAAMIARGLPPGGQRRFAFEGWPGDLWKPDTAAARIPTGSPLPRVLARDRDAGAIDATRANAERAGVADDLEIECSPLSDVPALPPIGLLMTNPPYGRRIGRTDPLRNLYARLGQIAARLTGWRAALVAASERIPRATGLNYRALTDPVDHGGTWVQLFELEARDRWFGDR